MPLMPAQDPVKRDLMDEIALLRKELRAMQKKVNDESSVSQARQEIVFSYPNLVTVGLYSGDYVVKYTDGVIQRLDVTSSVPPSVLTTLDLYINDGLAWQTEIGPGERLVTDDAILLPVEEWDTIKLAFSAGGNNMTNAVVHVIMTDSQDAL